MSGQPSVALTPAGAFGSEAHRRRGTKAVSGIRACFGAALYATEQNLRETRTYAGCCRYGPIDPPPEFGFDRPARPLRWCRAELAFCSSSPAHTGLPQCAAAESKPLTDME